MLNSRGDKSNEPPTVYQYKKPIKDEAARDAIRQINKALGGGDVEFFEFIRSSSVLGQHNYPQNFKEDFTLLMNHLGLEIEEGKRIVRKKKEKSSPLIK